MGPFVFSKEKTQKSMIYLLIALIPFLFYSVYKNGYVPYHNEAISFIGIFRPVFLILLGAFSSFALESLYLIIRKKKDLIFKSYSFFPGLFVALLLPVSTPFYLVILGAIVATVSKLLLGGFGKNILNPALVGYTVISIGNYIGNKLNIYELDSIFTASPLSNGSILEEFIAILCIGAYIYLAITKTIKWRIPLSYIGTVFLLTFIISRSNELGLDYSLYHILYGGLLFGAVFMATDPVTSATTPFGQILQGIFTGVLTIIFRFILNDGFAISILLVNLVIFLLDRIGAKARLNLMYLVIWLAICVALIMISGIVLAMFC